MYLRSVIAVCVFASVACNQSTAPRATHLGTGDKHLLFIGNSLTAANDMPAMVTALAESARFSPLPSADVAWLPDYALIDHWSDGRVQAVIAAGHFDVVFLQQGPTSVELYRDTLRLAARLFNPGIRGAGGVPALLSVWPTADRQMDFDRSTQSYQLAARDVGGYHMAAGETWRAAWRRDPTLQLYSPDGLPASFRLSDGQSFRTDTTTARVIQQAADEANRLFGMQPIR